MLITRSGVRVRETPFLWYFRGFRLWGSNPVCRSNHLTVEALILLASAVSAFLEKWYIGGIIAY